MSADSENPNITGGIWMKYCTVAKVWVRIGQFLSKWPAVRASLALCGRVNHHILESRCADRCANDAFLTSFWATLNNIPLRWSVLMLFSIIFFSAWWLFYSVFVCFSIYQVSWTRTTDRRDNAGVNQRFSQHPLIWVRSRSGILKKSPERPKFCRRGSIAVSFCSSSLPLIFWFTFFFLPSRSMSCIYFALTLITQFNRSFFFFFFKKKRSSSRMRPFTQSTSSP